MLSDSEASQFNLAVLSYTGAGLGPVLGRVLQDSL
jgi:hypothetical protein